VSETQQTTLRLRLAYGVGSVAYGVKDNGFSYLLLFYYDVVLGLERSWVAAALFAALLVDAISDPIVGYLSDHWRSRWGRRHPFMYFAAFPVSISYLFLWNPPSGLSQLQLLAWLFCLAILVRTLITLYEIPSTALVSELTENYDERTSLLSYRYFFGWWGGLTMNALAFLVLFPAAGGQAEPGGYQIYGWIAPGLMCAAILISAAGTHHRIPTLKAPPATDHHSARIAFRELKETLSNPSIRVLFGGAIFYGIAAGLSASINIYINTYFWGLDSEQIGLFSLSYFGSAMIALPLSPLLSRKFGKKRAAIGMSLFSLFMLPLVVSLRLFEVMPPNGTSALFFTLLSFNFVDVMLLISSTTLISAMVADVVEESEVSTGRRSEGVFFAARTFALKIVSGAGIFSAAVLLSAIGFPSDAAGGAEVAPEVLRRLGIVYVATAGTLYGIAIFFYSRYRISRQSHEDHLRSLAARGSGDSSKAQ